MGRLRQVLLALLLTTFTLEAGAVGVGLGGSPASVQRQNSVAKELGFTFIETSDEVTELVAADELVPVPGNAHYEVLESVSYKFARPELRMFLERLAEQYHEGTGERLVVTSLTRPSSEQPRNSHPLSVHPTGMAIDLRISSSGKSRAWIESVLLKLERQGVLDITRERYPPHYHVALFPDAYKDYLGSMIGEQALAAALQFPDPEPEAAQQESPRGGGAALSVAAAVVSNRPATADESTDSWKLIAVIPWLVVPIALLWRRRRCINRTDGEG